MTRLIPGLALVFALTVSACGSDDYVDRMAEQHAGETPTASPMADGASVPIASEEVTYYEVDGQAAVGYLARPEGAEEALPGVIVIHEWWGLNDNIRAMADELASQGYAALAVDLYGGSSATDAQGARSLMMAAMQDVPGARANLMGAHAYLTGTLGAPRVGSIGWCFGGAMSLQTALALPTELDAAVIYYGQVTDDREALATLEMPILGLFGAEDSGIPVDGVAAFHDTLAELGKDVTVQIYDGAGHAFANPSGNAYQEDAAEDSWMLTTAFFAEHLNN